MGLKYLCNTWQGFLQQIVTLVGHGYCHYCLTTYPEKKRSKWPEIDLKLINNYGADQSKDQRYRRQLKGMANYMFLRWENCALILRSPGEFVPGDDTFVSIADEPVVLQVGEILRLKIVPIGSRGHCTVYLDKAVYRDLKASLLDHCRHRRRTVLLNRFQALNNIPSYSGITHQKKLLVSDLIIEGRRHGLKLLRKDFPLRTSRKIFKVFD